MGINVMGTVSGMASLSDVNMEFNLKYSFRGLVDIISDFVEIGDTDLSFDSWEDLDDSSDTIEKVVDIASGYFDNDTESLRGLVDTGEIEEYSLDYKNVTVMRLGNTFVLYGDCTSDDEVDFCIYDFESNVSCWRDDALDWVRRNVMHDVSLGDLEYMRTGKPGISGATIEGEIENDDEYFEESY